MGSCEYICVVLVTPWHAGRVGCTFVCSISLNVVPSFYINHYFLVKYNCLIVIMQGGDTFSHSHPMGNGLASHLEPINRLSYVH
jgi:hypothetical protein